MDLKLINMWIHNFTIWCRIADRWPVGWDTSNDGQTNVWTNTPVRV